MKMKQMVSCLLVLVMLLGLLAGCGQQGGEKQPGTEPQAGQEATQTTELNDLAPPRIAEEFVPRLNAELKARDIPLEFIYQGEYSTQFQNEAGEWEPSCFGLYQAAFTDSGDPVKTETFDLSVDYWSEPTEPMLKLQIWVADDATDREREMHKTVCTIAAELCDAQMTEETARELLATEPSDTPYVIYTGEIGSFTKAEAIYVPSNDPNEENGYLDESMYSAVFWQGTDLTHTVYGSLSSDEEWYEIYFTQSGETLFGDRVFSAPSVEELEQRINDAFAVKGVPITCTLAPYQDYGQWRGVFRWTTLEDPDYAYPEFPLEDYLESGWAEEDITEELVAEYIRNSPRQAYLLVDASDPLRKDAPVGYIDIQFWGETPIPELAEVICIACDPENGAEDFAALQSMAPVPGDWEGYEERVLQKEDYSITQETNLEYESLSYSVEYDEAGNWYTQDPTGEELLDPALLDYEFQLSKPIVVDGLFNYYGDGQGYETYFYGSNTYFYLEDLLNDFLDYTRSHVYVDPYWDYGGEHYNIYGRIWGEGLELDSSVFRIDMSDVAIDFYYNVNIQDYLSPDMQYDSLEREHVLLIPIGISLLMDESMTVEEAIALHTHATEYDFIATVEDQLYGIAEEGFQVTVYGTGDVVHLLAENPETGENIYSVILRGYVEYDSDYSRLIQYLDD